MDILLISNAFIHLCYFSPLFSHLCYFFLLSPFENDVWTNNFVNSMEKHKHRVEQVILSFRHLLKDLACIF